VPAVSGAWAKFDDNYGLVAGAWTLIGWSAVREASAGSTWGSFSSGDVVVPTAGLYEIVAEAGYEAGATVDQILGALIQVKRGAAAFAQVSSGTTRMIVGSGCAVDTVAQVNLAAGDIVRVYVLASAANLSSVHVRLMLGMVGGPKGDKGDTLPAPGTSLPVGPAVNQVAVVKAAATGPFWTVMWDGTHWVSTGASPFALYEEVSNAIPSGGALYGPVLHVNFAGRYTVHWSCEGFSSPAQVFSIRPATYPANVPVTGISDIDVGCAVAGNPFTGSRTQGGIDLAVGDYAIQHVAYGQSGLNSRRRVLSIWPTWLN
jgi:hypothetical protein